MRINKRLAVFKAPAGISRLWIAGIAVWAFLVLSCPAETENGSYFGARTFWAKDLRTEKYYQTRADLLAEGRYCKIWVEQGPKAPALDVAEKIADAYDRDIYPNMIGTFSIDRTFVDEEGNTVATNIMELADWFTDRDGKLNILFLDIRDGYTPDGGYVGGYFWIGNFYQKNPADLRQYSNEMDMIYVDTDPGKPGEVESNKILAHEIQHLMNFVTSTQIRINEKERLIYLMDVWIDEGLSSAAEYVYLNSHAVERYGWFNEDPEGTIAQGNNFFVWGDRQGNSLLDDYATGYLFFQWLRLQSGSRQIYKDIISSAKSDYRAVTEEADKAMPGMGYADWGTLLKTWMAANYINAPSGPYGYLNESPLSTVRAKTAPAGTTSLSLLPGEGVYSITSTGGSTYASGRYIKYAGLDAGGGEVSDAETFAGGALLTYNANTNPAGKGETGRLTGIAAGISRSGGDVSRHRSVGGGAWEGPVRIDARDMPARNGGSREEGSGRAVLPLEARLFAGEAYGK
ncbi:MAG: hypothetical protein LBT87_05200 [Treponema sp.]|nr:hypothetical protein [Treponema sp.]